MKKEKQPAYRLSVRYFNGKSFVVDVESYRFDPEREVIDIFDRYGGKVATYDFVNDGIQRLDIYDVSKVGENLIQTILGRKVG